MSLEPLVPATSVVGVLQRLVATGRATVEDFDTPPPGHLCPDRYRNLLRAETPEPRVEISDPRDFDPSSCDF